MNDDTFSEPGRPRGHPALPAERPAVLVVDDDLASLRMLIDALEAQGYTVLIATSGDAALQRLAHVTPDAVLLDCMLPDISGFEVCRRIKSTPQARALPVIFMTGLGETEDIVRGFDCGGVDYVVKPVRIDEVLARLATHARNARLSRPAPEPAEGGSRIRDAALTPCETEVLSWVAKGKTNRDIADILGLSPRTVNKHLEHVFEKLGVETRAAAAALASREWP